jgi:hypothetical protein
MLGTTRGILLSTVILIAAFLLPALYRAYPFVDDVNSVISAGDDWLSYKENALSILHQGLTMPRVAGNYSRPGGFLYNYFIAAIFALTGENSTHVYLVQAILLALSVGLMVLAFKPYLTTRVTAIYFAALALFVFVDVFCLYTFRLLSENLVIFLLPIFCLLVLRSFETQSLFLGACAGLVCGLCVLCRPNLILLGPSTAVILFLYGKRKAARMMKSLTLLAGFCLTLVLLPLRNYAITGKMSMTAVTYSNDWLTPVLNLTTPLNLPKLAQAGLTGFGFYAGRILFCMGFTFLELPIYWLRPHWIIMWAGVLVFLWRAVKQRHLEFWEAFALTFILVYLGPLIAVGQISNYGVRMIVPVIPMLLLLAIKSLPPKLRLTSWTGAVAEQ